MNQIVQRFCFTLNNYTEDEFNAFSTEDFCGKFKYFIVGKEVCPTTGTPHLQGFGKHILIIRVDHPAGRSLKLYSGHFSMFVYASKISLLKAAPLF